MYIYGSFVNQKGDMVTVHIVTDNDRTDTLEIGAEGSGLFFTDDPVEISSDINDTFDHLLRHSASIRLQTSNLISDFFCTSCRYAQVNIFREGACLFAGFIEPQAYSQPYNEIYDELELSCIDALSALQYSKYRNIGNPGVSYESVKAKSGLCTFHSIVTGILDGIAEGLDITGSRSSSFWYDESKRIADGTSETAGEVFRLISISKALFLEDTEDDVWEQDTVLEEVLKYLNLHIIQEGLDFYIFSWETLRAGTAIGWREMKTGDLVTVERVTRTIGEEAFAPAGTDTSISVCETFNRIALTCKTKSTESLVENPLDGSSLYSTFACPQKYMTEYRTTKNADAWTTPVKEWFKTLLSSETLTEVDDKLTINEWYVQVMRNKNWRFPVNTLNCIDIMEHFDSDINQQNIPNHLGLTLCSAILSIGKAERNASVSSRNPVTDIGASSSLVLSVNGNGEDGEEGSGAAYPSDYALKQARPMAVYENDIAQTLSPSDDSIINYIVISGTFRLESLAPESYNAYNLLTVPNLNNITLNRVENNSYIIIRQWWQAEKPTDDETMYNTSEPLLVPGISYEKKEYECGNDCNSTTAIPELPLLKCMLIVGGKCLVEKNNSVRQWEQRWWLWRQQKFCQAIGVADIQGD